MTRARVPKTMDEILDSPDELGLLKDVEPERTHVPVPSPAESAFLEICAFVRGRGREPSEDSSDLKEQSLARKLKTFRSGSEMADPVRRLDDLGLLACAEAAPAGLQAPEAPEAREAPGWDPAARRWTDGAGPRDAEGGESSAPAAPKSMADILDEPDELGLLDVNAGIFDLKHVRSAAERHAAAPPDEIGQRRPCQDFWRYEGLFRQAHGALGTDAAVLRQPKKKHVHPGSMFILRGQLCFVDSVLEGRDGTRKDGYQNSRLHVVFDNGTELDILQYSLTRAMQKDKNARFVDMSRNQFSRGGAPAAGKDRKTGFVYVLETLSEAPELAELKASHALVKIGYSTKSVDERIAGAERDQTFLCAPVRKAAEVECHNMDPRKFEKLIHAVLHERRFGVSLRNRWTGRTYRPQEWFLVDVETAVRVCWLIVEGKIGKYRIDAGTGKLVER